MREYKTIGVLPPFTLPDFTVITGENGVGKTQLLQAITSRAIEVTLDDQVLGQNEIQYFGSIAYTQYQSKSADIPDEPENLLKVFQSSKHDRGVLQTTIIGNRRAVTTLEQIATHLEKKIDELSDNDILDHYPFEAPKPQSVFAQDLASLFKVYHVRWEENARKRFMNSEYGAKHVVYSQEEFKEKYGPPPWEVMNDLMSDANIPYRFLYDLNSNAKASFVLLLYSTISDTKISPTELSSGEKVLISLVLALYNSEAGFQFPKLLLLDEPDAALHPQMVSQMLGVLQTTFLKKNKLRIIIVTHSPSTVALSDESSLRVMQRSAPRINACNKDSALRSLTFGVPFLSIQIENRRQIFTESIYDAQFYERISGYLRDHLDDSISLNFIAVGKKKGTNCDWVKETTSAMRQNGVSTIYGIIDYDNGNTETEFVKVPGSGSRHSIENFILDPLIIAIYLLRENLLSADKIGLNSVINYYDLYTAEPFPST